jgi:hypothetical protein
LIFVKFRLLWIAISNVFDLQCDHNQQFIAQEICKGSELNTEVSNIKHEDRFQFNNEPEEKVFLWGNKSKKYDEDCDRKVQRLFGYSKV